MALNLPFLSSRYHPLSLCDCRLCIVEPHYGCPGRILCRCVGTGFDCEILGISLRGDPRDVHPAA